MSFTVIGAAVAAGVGSAAISDLALTAITESKTKPGRGSTALRRPLLTLILFVGRCLGQRAPKGLQIRLLAAGSETPARQFMAVKTGSATVALLSCLLLTGSLGSFTVMAFVGLPLLAFFAPDLWLMERAKRRKQLIEQELGDVLELVRVAIGAGMGIRRALAEVGVHQKGLLATELRRTSDQIVFGETYETALTDFEARCPSHGVATFVAAVRRAQKHGTSLSQPLAAAIERTRADCARNTAEAAARAAPKIQLIVALLLVPSVLLLIAATVIPLFLHPSG